MELTCTSRISRPVREPWLADVHLATKSGRPAGELGGAVGEIARTELEKMDELATGLLEGAVCVY